MSEQLARMKEQYHDQEALRVHLTGYLAEHGLSQERASKETGVSAAALNQFLSGKYKGDNSTLSDKLIIWLASRERRGDTAAALAVPGYTETDTAGKILKVLHFAQAAGDLSVVYGGAGVGKTTTIRHYAAHNPNVWVVTMRPDTATVAACLEEIGESMGLRSFSRSNRLSRDICRRLEDTRGLIVIDEAQHLSVPAIEAIRSIHDATGIGLVLSGNESVYARLTGGSRAASFAQLFSRIGKKLRLTRTTAADVGEIAALHGIAGAKEIAFLTGISQKPGALRGVVKTLRLAAMFAGGELPNHEHLAAAWRDLGGEA